MPSVRRLVAVAALAAGAAVPRAATAQDLPASDRPPRFTIGGYLSNAWYDRGGSLSRASIGGFGVRLMMNRSDPAQALRTFFDRASFGAFATFTTEQNAVAASQHIGAQVDVALLQRPAGGGFIDPHVSVGLGALREDLPNDDADVNLALSPGAGVRIPFFSGIGARGDFRLMTVFGQDTRINPVLEGGIYISF
jgi:hypothetical protein